MKSLDLLERYQKRGEQLAKEIDNQRDIFWNKFLSHRNVLSIYGYLQDDFPTDKGKTASQIRSENELFLAEIIFSGVLDNLTPAELASVICAITTEDMRADMYSQLPLSQKVRKTLNKIKDIRRKLERVQNENNVDDCMYINSFYCALIECGQMVLNGTKLLTKLKWVKAISFDVSNVLLTYLDNLQQ